MKVTVQFNHYESEMIQNLVIKTLMTLGHSPMDAIGKYVEFLNIEEYDVNLITKVSSNTDGTELVLKTSDKVGSFILGLLDKVTGFAVDIMKWIEPAVKQATANTVTLRVIDEQGNELSALYIDDAPEPEMFRECIQGDNISRVYINTRAALDYDHIIPDGVIWEYVTDQEEAVNRLKELNSQKEA